MKKTILGALLFLGCVPQLRPGEVAIHLRPGGHRCQLMCGASIANVSDDECAKSQEFLREFIEAIDKHTLIMGACQAFMGHTLVVVDADDHGSFKVGEKWVNGATDCDGHVSFVGLPPSDPRSATAHELVHVVECRTGRNPDHVGWEDKQYCTAIREVSTFLDGCEDPNESP